MTHRYHSNVCSLERQSIFPPGCVSDRGPSQDVFQPENEGFLRIRARLNALVSRATLTAVTAFSTCKRSDLVWMSVLRCIPQQCLSSRDTYWSR